MAALPAGRTGAQVVRELVEAGGAVLTGRRPTLVHVVLAPLAVIPEPVRHVTSLRTISAMDGTSSTYITLRDHDVTPSKKCHNC